MRGWYERVCWRGCWVLERKSDMVFYSGRVRR